MLFSILSLCLTFWGPKTFSYVVFMDLQIELYCVRKEVIVYELVAGSHLMELAMKLVQLMVRKLSRGIIENDNLSELSIIVSLDVL